LQHACVSKSGIKALDNSCPYFSTIIVSLNTSRNNPKYGRFEVLTAVLGCLVDWDSIVGTVTRLCV
jgi:hypothetical protein